MRHSDHFEIIKKLDQIYIPHTHIESVTKNIVNCIELSHVTSEPVNFLLTGVGGTGKTTVCNFLMKKYPSFIEKKDGYATTCIPIINASIPSGASIKDLISHLLDSINDDSPTRGTRTQLTFRLESLLRNCKTKTIILDEFQHLLRSEKVKYQPIIDWIKTLNNQLMIPFIIVGSPQCKNMINADNQVSRRFTHRFELKNLNVDEHHKFVNTFANRLKMDSKLSFAENMSYQRNTLAIYAATGGNPADTTTLFRQSIHEQFIKNDELLSLEHFQLAYNNLSLPNAIVNRIKQLKNTNPFTIEIEQLSTNMKNWAKRQQ